MLTTEELSAVLNSRSIWEIKLESSTRDLERLKEQVRFYSKTLEDFHLNPTRRHEYEESLLEAQSELAQAEYSIALSGNMIKSLDSILGRL